MNTSGKIGLVLSSLGLAFTLLLYLGLFLYVLKTYGGFDGFMQESLNFYGVDSIEELYQMMGVPY